jgi:hypothetical protein
MEILTPLLHHTFVNQQLDADESPFARSQSSTGSARIQTDDSIARESAQRDRERELWVQEVQNLQHVNVASKMARIAMAHHVPDPPKLVSLDYKKIHHWLKIRSVGWNWINEQVH